MKIPSQIATLLIGVIVTLLSLWYGQNNGLLPVAASEEATQVDGIFNFMMTVATGLFLLVEGIVIYCAFKFRRKAGDNTDGPPIEGNVPLEIVWTAIPTVIVFIIAVYSFEVYNAMGGLDPMASFDPGPGQVAQANPSQEEGLLALDPSQGDVALGLGASPEYQGKVTPLEVEVSGLQYAWVFNYPASGVTAGELHIPLGRPIRLKIQAQDVLHAFWLPEFRIKQDAIPGRETELQFTASRLGDYPVICAELCGPYHGAMNTRLYVESADDYDNWIQSQVAMQASQGDTVALNASGDAGATQFLAPHLEAFGVNEGMLEQLHSHH